MILITGHKGFIGSHLAKHFTSQNQAIMGLDSVDGHPDDALYLIPWNKITKIYHQGAISDTTETDVEKIFNHNIKFSLDLFEIAQHHNIPVVYASSASIYGNQGLHYNPLNYYALSKLTIDLWVQDNMHQFKNIVGFRYFNVYGENENKKDWTMSPVSKFTQQAKETGIIKVFEGSENMTRDFVCVEDVIEIITRDYESGIYDLGSGDNISFLKVAQLIANKYDAAIKFIPFPEKLRNKYQFYTNASQEYEYEFKTVEQWLETH